MNHDMQLNSDNVSDVRQRVPDDKVLFNPYPKQEVFLSCEEDEVLFGGARGGGKTASLIIDASLKVRKWHYEGNAMNMIPVVDKYSIDYPEYTALILRRTFDDIYMNFKPDAEKIYFKLGAVWREKKKAFIFPSGARIHLAYCDNMDDVKKYIGGNYHYLGVEELNQFPEAWIKMLGGSIRSTNPELKPYKRYTTNPGGVGHVWIKKYFIDKCPPKRGRLMTHEQSGIKYTELNASEPYIDDDGNSRLFVPSLVFDNPALIDNDTKYVGFLNSLDETRRNMWLLGDWDTLGGVFFSEFSKFHHVISAKDFKLDKDSGRIYRCVDYGTANPFACMFLHVNVYGYVTVFDEIYETGLVPSAQAKRIRDFTAKWGLTEDDIHATIVDPSMKIKSHEYLNTLHSSLDIYLENGIEHIVLGNNDRVQGWATFREFLRVPEEGSPAIVFCDNCVNAIETIPSLVTSERNPEDLNTQGDDHCVSGDTLIETVNGRIPIRDLVGSDGYCFGWNESEKRLGATWFRNARKTRLYTEIWKLTMDDGSILRATPDHQIMLRDGTYKELKDLKKGESLMPSFYKVNNVEFYGYEDTYCMTTGLGNFATDTIVVHNCADSIRYALMFLDKPRIAKPMESMKKWQQELFKKKSDTTAVTVNNVWA